MKYVALILFITSAAHAQLASFGQWSVAVHATTNPGVSDAMGGTIYDFKDELANDFYNNSRYPFQGSMPLGVQGEIALRLLKSPLSVFAEYHTTHFHADNGQSGSNENSVEMFFHTLTAGCEYSFGDKSDAFNTFGRGGIAYNNISGSVVFSTDGNNPVSAKNIAIPAASRIGFEGEIGERWNMPVLPFALELAVNYTQANTIGKSYTDPRVQPPEWPTARELNDAAYPDRGMTMTRVLAFMSLRVGVRWWV